MYRIVLQQYTVTLVWCEETDSPDMYVASVKMTAVATMAVGVWERPSCGDKMIAVSVCVMEGAQNARAMKLHHSAVWNLCWINFGD
jgi:hypothetical protein